MVQVDLEVDHRNLGMRHDEEMGEAAVTGGVSPRALAQMTNLCKVI